MASMHRYRVAYYLTFRSVHKLLTVLRGRIDQELSAEEHVGIDQVLEALQVELGRQLTELLTGKVVASLAVCFARLRLIGRFPALSGDMPAIPGSLF